MISGNNAVIQRAVRAASPLAIIVGLYLLFAGHNNPGGGFAAGLVFGAVITLRTLAGLQQPAHATAAIAAGMAIVTIVALAPLLWGKTMLDQQVISVEWPLLGTIKSGSALPFDIGVAAIVVGLVIALLHGLSRPASGQEPNEHGTRW